MREMISQLNDVGFFICGATMFALNDHDSFMIWLNLIESFCFEPERALGSFRGSLGQTHQTTTV